MSLIKQFHITLRDLWPSQSDAMLITDRHNRKTAMISRQLYAKLKAHADDKEVPVHSIVEQLCNEIETQPVIKNNLTPASPMPRFVKGDRVRLSATTIESLRHAAGSSASMAYMLQRPDWPIAQRRGTVAYTSQQQKAIAIIWDGTKKPQYITNFLLELSDD